MRWHRANEMLKAPPETINMQNDNTNQEAKSERISEGAVDQPRLVRLDLTPEQAEALSEVLYDYQDRGPQGEGWASKGLQELRNLVDEAIGQSLPNTGEHPPR